MKKKKSCANCQKYIVCLQSTGEEPKEVCNYWKLEYNEFEELFKGRNLINIKDSEISKIIRENYE